MQLFEVVIDDMDKQSCRSCWFRSAAEGLDLGLHHLQNGLNGDVDGGCSIVGAGVEHPHENHKSYRVKARNVGEDEA